MNQGARKNLRAVGQTARSRGAREREPVEARTHPATSSPAASMRRAAAASGTEVVVLARSAEGVDGKASLA